MLENKLATLQRVITESQAAANETFQVNPSFFGSRGYMLFISTHHFETGSVCLWLFWFVCLEWPLLSDLVNGVYLEMDSWIPL